MIIMNLQERHQYAREKYGLLRNDLRVLHEMNYKGIVLAVIRKNPNSIKIDLIIGDCENICTKATFYRIEPMLKAIRRAYVFNEKNYYDHYVITDEGREIL